MNASCDGNVDVSVRAGLQVAADEGVKAHITMIHVTHVNESWHTCEQVISQVTFMAAFDQALIFAFCFTSQVTVMTAFAPAFYFFHICLRHR